MANYELRGCTRRQSTIILTKERETVFFEEINFFPKFKNRLLEAKIDEVAITSAISLYEANITAVQGRLNRLLSDISKEDKKLEVVPAFARCQEILVHIYIRVV